MLIADLLNLVFGSGQPVQFQNAPLLAWTFENPGTALMWGFFIFIASLAVFMLLLREIFCWLLKTRQLLLLAKAQDDQLRKINNELQALKLEVHDIKKVGLLTEKSISPINNDNDPAYKGPSSSVPNS